MGILWATFLVNDMEKSLAFYNGILGMPIRERFTAPQDGAEIVMLGEEGGGLLELISRGASENPGQGITIGLPFADLEAIGETLSLAGYAPGPVIAPLPGVKFRFVKDPDGYQIQLVERGGNEQ